MRLWSIHPKYLDAQGLVALWREGLLAQKVLAGKTKGYKHHPQLIRFRKKPDPLIAIGTYLHHVAREAKVRNYRFNSAKILKPFRAGRGIKVTRLQLRYEFEHLLKKLSKRDPVLYQKWKKAKTVVAHPSFKITPGGIESWEILKKRPEGA